MNVVVIGDIGWRYLYHLGDEAMTEAAIDMLRARGIDDITLVAGQPEVGEAFYGLPCVSRVGFRAAWSRDRMNSHLERVTAVLAEGNHAAGTIYAAIRDCDVVLIAGGGNMNSNDYHLLYERVASARIAEYFGKPLYVTSQTVGPALTEHDRDLVMEIADFARGFGAREATTEALMREHAARPELVFGTLDDATVLSSDADAHKAVDELAGERTFVVASFTHHGGSMWPDDKSYHSDIATLVRGIAEHHDVDVLLAPHAGSLDDGERQRDQDGNDAIAALADSDRVRALRMITAREDVALIERARLSLSTRYHPLIFAAAVGTPAVAIANSHYSSVRMRGAMSNVGLQAFVVPATSMELVPDAVAEAIDPDARLTAQLAATKKQALALQHRWWDALVAAMRTGANVEFEAEPPVPAYEPSGAWTTTVAERDPYFARLSALADERKFLAIQLSRVEEESRERAAALERARAGLERYRQRKVIRLLDRLSGLRRRR